MSRMTAEIAARTTGFRGGIEVGVPTVACCICGRQVTKRSTLSLAELGGNPGRACREHQEVTDLLQRFRSEARTQAAEKEAMDGLQVLSATALVRVWHTLRGIDPELIYTRLELGGFPNDLIPRLRKSVEQAGGPRMTDEEFSRASLTASVLTQKINDLKIDQ